MIASPPVSVIPYIVVKRKNLKNLILVNIEISVLKPKYLMAKAFTANLKVQ
jgi:hypothetical protein